MKKINVVCGVIVKDNKYLITQRGDSKNINKWEFPGGKVERSENIFDAIKRELKEELSIEVTPIKKLLEYNYKKYNLCFIECTLGSNKIILNEHLNSAWISKKEFEIYDFLEGDNIFINSLLTKP
jgi:8-oxo-dGTP diphosphatase